MPPELAKSMSFGGMSSRSGSRHRGQLASVRSQLSIQRSSSARSANSNRSNRSTHSLRDSCGVSTGCDSIKDLKFDAMLEPDAGSNHTLVDSAFRDKGYQWIINQVERKTTAALDVHKKYLDDDVQHDVKLFHGGDVVDAARNRIVLTNLDVFANCLWDTLTESAATPMWRIQRLEEVDAATCYTQVSVVDGISPGHPLVMNVLLRLVRVSVDRQVIVLRSIAEDAKFPLPHQSIAFSVSGWIVLDRTLTPTKRRLGDRAETQAPDKGFAPMHDDDPDQAAAILGDWLMDAIGCGPIRVMEPPPFAPATRAVLLGFLAAVPLVMLLVAPWTELLPLGVLYTPPGLVAVAVLRYTHSKNKTSCTNRVDIDALVHLFLAGCSIGVIVAMLIEMVLTLVAQGCFLVVDNRDVLGQIERYRAEHPGNGTSAGDILAHIRVRHSFSILLTLSFMAFIVAGTVEESVKAWLVLRRPCRPCCSTYCDHLSRTSDVPMEPSLQSRDSVVQTSPRQVVLGFIVVGCGFSTMENALYAFLAPSLAMQLWTAAIRSALATPLHMICASLTGMHLVLQLRQNPPTTRSRWDVLRAIAPAMLLHGVYDLQAFLFTFWLEVDDGSVMSLSASVLCLVVGGLYLNYLRGRIQWDDVYHAVPSVEDAADFRASATTLV
ncbi:hypothetical protein H310_08141 [Aphanomyces invadans]|uniref:Uncharacterized protein n=1 Tax=Aphanomyces invadans TaxID=157072 RepID=A0A024TZN8_9STRA|nr:hypothetical protein H310_08141 [Aphanomyces invadans]ETV99458.1 hypothetical protein H310_08141 [Aphanomyces invadans]|eukprot:XP_008872014.1 hypothetical protein H310_08141 [Aphanomyces invadans]